MLNFSQIHVHRIYIAAIIGISLTYYYQNDLVSAKKFLEKAMDLKPILQQEVGRYEVFKNEGCFSETNSNALKKMILELK